MSAAPAGGAATDGSAQPQARQYFVPVAFAWLQLGHAAVAAAGVAGMAGAAGVIGSPQARQNFAPAVFVCPQRVHSAVGFAASGVPQPRQNFAAAWFSVPHCAQRDVIAGRSPSLAVWWWSCAAAVGQDREKLRARSW